MFKEMINTNKMKLSSQTSLILLAVVIGLFFVYAHIQETKVAPIKRFYMYSRHSRRFYPKEYIDEYDLKHGDYIPE